VLKRILVGVKMFDLAIFEKIWYFESLLAKNFGPGEKSNTLGRISLLKVIVIVFSLSSLNIQIGTYFI